jgi:hypothetical protein
VAEGLTRGGSVEVDPMTYVLLIYASRPPDQAVTEAEHRAAMVGHRRLQAGARESGDLLSVAQLTDPRRARTVRAHAGAHEVTDGPFLETKEWLVGFYLVECDDEAAAIARARMICDDGHAIEVRPVTWTWAR